MGLWPGSGVLVFGSIGAWGLLWSLGMWCVLGSGVFLFDTCRSRYKSVSSYLVGDGASHHAPTPPMRARSPCRSGEVLREARGDALLLLQVCERTPHIPQGEDHWRVEVSSPGLLHDDITDAIAIPKERQGKPDAAGAACFPSTEVALVQPSRPSAIPTCSGPRGSLR